MTLSNFITITTTRYLNFSLETQGNLFDIIKDEKSSIKEKFDKLEEYNVNRMNLFNDLQLTIDKVILSNDEITDEEKEQMTLYNRAIANATRTVLRERITMSSATIAEENKKANG